MAADLRELRARITLETDAVLDAMATVLDKERAEIVRDVLHKWAEEWVAIGTLTHKRLRAEGVSAAHEGGSAAGEGRAGIARDDDLSVRLREHNELSDKLLRSSQEIKELIQNRSLRSSR